jgi:uncharacterized protein YpmB
MKKEIIIIGIILVVIASAYFSYKKYMSDKLVNEKKAFQIKTGLDADQVEQYYIKNGNKL